MDAVLQQCAALIGVRDLEGCRSLALSAHSSDADHPGPLQALAVVQVLSAAEKRLPGGHRDWYGILQVQPTSEPAAVRSQFVRLLHLLNPSRNAFPFADESLQLVMRAWHVLSDKEEKAAFDQALAAPATFHTMCPYCYYIFEYDIVHKDCCIRCDTCRRPFHSVPIPTPLPKVVTFMDEDGRMEEGYHCRMAHFLIKYHINPDILEVGKSDDAPVVQISSDGEDVGGGGGSVKVSTEEMPRKRRVKTRARKTVRRTSGRVAERNRSPVPPPQANNDNGTNHGMDSDSGVTNNGNEAGSIVRDTALRIVFTEDNDVFIEIP